jgi:hypothetical protein
VRLPDTLNTATAKPEVTEIIGFLEAPAHYDFCHRRRRHATGGSKMRLSFAFTCETDEAELDRLQNNREPIWRCLQDAPVDRSS